MIVFQTVSLFSVTRLCYLQLNDMANEIHVTVLSQGSSLLRYASHSNLPTTSNELSSVAFRIGPASGSKSKPGRSLAVSAAKTEHAGCWQR